jgi:hypothetical protein
MKGTLMWEALKNAATGIKDALGIEIPDLPVDLTSLGDTANTTMQAGSETLAGATDSLSAAGSAVTEGVPGIAESASGIAQTTIDNATQALPDVDLTGIANPSK